MRVCPLCETPVAGPQCEVCGHALTAAPAPAAAVPRLLELELPPSAGAPSLAPLLDLEPTRFAVVPAPGAFSDPEVERTAAPPAPDVAAGGLPELDLGRAPDDPERTPTDAGPVTCRYCRHVQAVGLLCDQCGMRLPRNVRAALATGPAPDRDALIRCPRCGERTYQRERCSSCGSVLTAGA
jgi:hypothetical protein